MRPATRSRLHSPRGDVTSLWFIVICSEHIVPYAKEQRKEISLGYIYDCAQPRSLRHSLAILLVCVRGKQDFGIEAGHRYVDISAFHEAVTSSSATHFGGCPDRRARTLSGNLTEMSFRMSETWLWLGTFHDSVFPARGIGEGLEAEASISEPAVMHVDWLAGWLAG